MARQILDRVVVRAARMDDLQPLLAMQARSLRGLGAHYYAPAVLDAALYRMGTMDPRLITDGSYLLAEIDGHLASSAGWSLRAPNYAQWLSEPPPALPGTVGLVRSVFVSPDFSRLGLGRRMMHAVEARLAAQGVATAELMATLSGVPLYAALGYRALSGHFLQLTPDISLEVRRMARCLATPDAVLAA